MYEAFYGLTVKPFQLNPAPEFYFASKQHRRVMAYLEYGVHQNEGFIVVSGDVGAGKTTMVRGLCTEIPPQEMIGTFETERELFLHEMPDKHRVVIPWEARPGSGEVGPNGTQAGEITLLRSRGASTRQIVSLYPPAGPSLPVPPVLIPPAASPPHPRAVCFPATVGGRGQWGGRRRRGGPRGRRRDRDTGGGKGRGCHARDGHQSL